MRSCVWMWGSILVLAPGCRFDRAGLASVDLGQAAPDSAVFSADRGVPDQLGDQLGDQPDLGLLPDQSRPDQQLPDLGLLPDLAPPDQARPDQQLPDQALPDQQQPDLIPPPCATKYGGVNGFKPCPGTTTECVFYFVGGTCNDHCGNNGGTCIKSANDTNNGCEISTDETCSYNHSDGVCYCSR